MAMGPWRWACAAGVCSCGIFDELGPVLGAPHEAGRGGVRPSSRGTKSRAARPLSARATTARPAYGDFAGGPCSQPRLADAEQMAGRVLRVDAFELRIHARLAGARRHLDLELPGPAEQRGLQPVHADALRVPEDVARIARHGHAVERALSAVQAPGHTQPALVEADGATELAVAFEAEVAGQHMTVQDREVHFARRSTAPHPVGERDASAIGEIGAIAGERAGLRS